MGVLTHIFVASLEVASQNDGAGSLGPEARAEWRNYQTTHLVPLCDEIVESCPNFGMVAKNEDYSQLTFAFPDAFVAALSSLEADRVPAVVQGWARSDVLWQPDLAELQDLLGDLIRLASRAQEFGQGLYIWNGE